jgi:formate hydrogenlyase subunit 4
MTELLIQLAQVALTLMLAPALTGFVRKVKARLVGRCGPPVIQPYRDLARLFRKEAVLAPNASWLFRTVPYLVFALTWLTASLVPGATSVLALAPTADLIALIAILASARFLLALAGMDVGTAFGGIGSSREMMIAAIAEPAMLMVTFTVALVAHSTSLPEIARFVIGGGVGLEVSMALALVAVIMVAIAENGRVPVDNPATHLELTMVHEAMVLEYSGRHLAMIEAAAMVKLLVYVSLVSCIFVPWGMALDAAPAALALGVAAYVTKLAAAGVLLAFFETAIAKMRVFRVAEFLGGALMLALVAAVMRLMSEGLG